MCVHGGLRRDFGVLDKGEVSVEKEHSRVADGLEFSAVRTHHPIPHVVEENVEVRI